MPNCAPMLTEAIDQHWPCVGLRIWRILVLVYGTNSSNSVQSVTQSSRYTIRQARKQQTGSLWRYVLKYAHVCSHFLLHLWSHSLRSRGVCLDGAVHYVCGFLGWWKSGHPECQTSNHIHCNGKLEQRNRTVVLSMELCRIAWTWVWGWTRYELIWNCFKIDGCNWQYCEKTKKGKQKNNRTLVEPWCVTLNQHNVQILHILNHATFVLITRPVKTWKRVSPSWSINGGDTKSRSTRFRTWHNHHSIQHDRQENKKLTIRGGMF